MSSVSQKYGTELGQAPTSQARSRDTDHLRPSNLAARTLSLVEHTLSKFSGDPCPVRRGIVAAVKCCVRKARFFAVQAGCGTEQEKPEPCVGFNVSTPQRGKTVLFCFRERYLSASTTGTINTVHVLFRCPESRK